MKKIEEVVNLSIANGANSGRVTFQPQAGLVIACAVFTNDAANAGFVNARITTDDGLEISPASDIKNYRDREAGYREGKKPLYLETGGKAFVFEVFSSENFTADFKAQLVLVYEPDYTKQNC